MTNKRLALDIGLTFVYLIIFYWVTHGLMLIQIIDDGVFVFSRVFTGFLHWIYLIPLIVYLRKKQKPFKGFIIGGLLISMLNTAFIIWIILDPSTFI